LDAERHLRRGESIARRFGHRIPIASLTLGLSWAYLSSGPLQVARQWAEQAEHDAREDGQPLLAGIAEAVRTVAAAASDGSQGPDLAPVLSRPDDRDHWLAAHALAALADAAATLGVGGRELARAAGTTDPARMPAGARARYLEGRTLAALVEGDLPGAQARLTEMAHAVGRLAGQRACWLRATAAVLAAANDDRGAAQALADAARGFADAGLSVDQARTELALAVTLRRCGSNDDAVRAAERAANLAAHVGARRIRASADDLRSMLRAAAAVRRPADDIFAALTERESEIARLVGSGGTSRQVAEHLHLSTRTVETHLARIYRKLNLSSRSDLARLVEREACRITLPGG